MPWFFSEPRNFTDTTIPLLSEHFLPYLENRSTSKLTNFPSRLGGFTRSSVISIQVFCLSSEFRNNTLTSHVEPQIGLRFKSCCSRREIGSRIVTGFKNWTPSERLIRRTGPRNTPSSSNSSFETSCTWSIRNENHQLSSSLKKQTTFGDPTNGFPAKWRLRKERRNSILMTRRYPDLGSASNWLCRLWNLLQSIRSTSKIWIVTCHQYGISALISQTSFRGKPPVASRNVVCFLKLVIKREYIMIHYSVMLELDQGFFTPLVFTATGGMADEKNAEGITVDWQNFYQPRKERIIVL